MKKHIPNFVSLLNLFFGCLSIVFFFEGSLQAGAFCILLAAIFDFLDGTLARLLNSYSDIGKQLDSLADVVSFGVAPGVIAFTLLSNYCGEACIGDLTIPVQVAYIGFLIPVFSALRLARFNVDEEQSVYFKGLSTTANGILWASFAFIAGSNSDSFFATKLTCTPFLISITLLHCYLLVSDIAMFSLKGVTKKPSKNIPTYIWLVGVLISIIFLQVEAIPYVIYSYIILSVLFFKPPR